MIPFLRLLCRCLLLQNGKLSREGKGVLEAEDIQVHLNLPLANWPNQWLNCILKIYYNLSSLRSTKEMKGQKAHYPLCLRQFGQSPRRSKGWWPLAWKPDQNCSTKNQLNVFRCRAWSWKDKNHEKFHPLWYREIDYVITICLRDFCCPIKCIPESKKCADQKALGDEESGSFWFEEKCAMQGTFWFEEGRKDNLDKLQEVNLILNEELWDIHSLVEICCQKKKNFSSNS